MPDEQPAFSVLLSLTVNGKLLRLPSDERARVVDRLRSLARDAATGIVTAGRISTAGLDVVYSVDKASRTLVVQSAKGDGSASHDWVPMR